MALSIFYLSHSEISANIIMWKHSTKHLSNFDKYLNPEAKPKS